MAEKTTYSTYQPSDICIVANAVRNVKSAQLQTRSFMSKPITCENRFRPKIQIPKDKGEIKRIVFSTQSQARNFPQNMVVSKIATRKTSHQENDLLEKCDITSIRKLPEPSWNEKQVNKKRLQSAYVHNMRQRDKILAMTSRLKRPSYDPDDLALKHGCSCLPCTSSESSCSQGSSIYPSKRRFDQPRRFSQSTPIVVDAYNYPLGDDVISYDHPGFDQESVDQENMILNSTPCDSPIKNSFVWNPVILPAPKSSISAIDLLEHHYSSQDESNTTKDWFDSPGTCTSSTSSGLTVAEETVRLTYYTDRGRVPLTERNRTSEQESFMYNTVVEQWPPHRHHFDITNYYEE